MDDGQPAVTGEMEDEAMLHYFAIIDAEGNLAPVLSRLNEWLSENPAHQVAWERKLRTSRLIAAYLKASEPGSSAEELHEFWFMLSASR